MSRREEKCTGVKCPGGMQSVQAGCKVSRRDAKCPGVKKVSILENFKNYAKRKHLFQHFYNVFNINIQLNKNIYKPGVSTRNKTDNSQIQQL